MKLLANEKALRVYRQTKMVIFWYFLISLILAFLPISFLSRFELSLGKLPTAWIILIALYFFNHMLLWRMNVTLLTTHRLLIVSSHNILHKQVTDLPKDKIVNIAYEKKGLAQTLFNFGNLLIQQQSVNQPVILKRLPDPSLVKDQINSSISK